MCLPVEDILLAKPHPIWDTRRLWSLWDMINFQLGPFWQALKALQSDIRLASFAQERDSDGAVPDEYLKNFKNNVYEVTRDCVVALKLKNVHRQLVNLEKYFDNRLVIRGWKELVQLLNDLHDAIQEEIKHENFFHYPREIVSQIYAIDREWPKTISNFPSLRKGIEHALDCFALDDYSGCVFHAMGLAEAGLRAIAKERGIRSSQRQEEGA